MGESSCAAGRGSRGVSSTARPSRKQTLLPAPGGLTGAGASRLGDCRLITLWRSGCGAPTPPTLHCWVDARPVNRLTRWDATVPGPRNRRDVLLSAALDGFTRRGYD